MYWGIRPPLWRINTSRMVWKLESWHTQLRGVFGLYCLLAKEFVGRGTKQ